MEYIARISKGKDSLKMLDVIVSRGLPLDRITTTDIWATDTIRGEHPKMVEFESFIDEYIWKKYRIEVEHLCAMRNGEKVTYEKMFYHVPKRKEGRNTEYEGLPAGFPLQKGAWCQKLKHIWVPDVFRQPLHKGQERYCGIHWHSRRRAEAIWAA